MRSAAGLILFLAVLTGGGFLAAFPAEASPFPFNAVRILDSGLVEGDAGNPPDAKLPSIRSVPLIETDKDGAFGAIFALEGGAVGEVVPLEARLFQDEANGESGAAPAQRWFFSARIGRPALAAYSLSKDSPLASGSWTLALYCKGELAAEIPFDLTASPDGGNVPEPSAGEGGGSSEGPQKTADSPSNGGQKPAPAPQSSQSAQSAPQSASSAQPMSAAPSAQSGPQADAGEAPVKISPKPQPVSSSPPSAASASKTVSGKAAVPAAQPPREKDKKPAAKPSPKPVEVFAVQTGAFSKKDNADRLAARLRARNFPVCVVRDGRGKKPIYRVLAGKSGGRDAALKSRARLIGAGIPDAIVKSLPSALFDESTCR